MSHTFVQEDRMGHHVFPWWKGFKLLNPKRAARHPAAAILSPFVRPGMTVSDLGCGMGYFSIPLARLVGKEGRVHCIDLQKQMLAALSWRAAVRGLGKRISTRTCGPDSLGVADLAGTIDFALAFNVAHETPEGHPFLSELAAMLKPDGRALLCEPNFRVSESEFAALLEKAQRSGFTAESAPEIAGERCALLSRRSAR
jgi:ubiquinone/menaquinone biosynthesis C-methylase UbiE